MTQINKVDINKNYLSPRQNSRSYSVYGDPGAMFNITVTNSDGEYYNFPENTIIENPNTQSLPTPSYSSSPTKLNTVTIGGTGVYSSSITFEASNTEDEYTLTIYPQMHNGTTLNFGANKSSYIFAKIKQLTDSKIAFDLLSLADNSSYNAYPAHISFKGDNGRVTPVPIPSTQSISWTPTLNAGDFVLARQPLANDFYFDFVQRIYATSGGATTIEVKDISKLSIGMEVTHAHINTGAVILSITPGYYNATKSTAVFPVYDIPIVANETSPNKPTLQQDKGGTIVIDKTLAEGIADNTVIIIMSDQGGAYTNSPLSGGKKGGNALGEGGARVPLLINYPGITKANTETDIPVQSIDIYPTLIEIASGKKCEDKQINGVSLMPIIKGKNIEDRSLYFFRSYEDQYAAVISGDWKLVKYHSGKFQLFNVTKDISEQNDLIATGLAIENELKTNIANWETEAVPQY